MRADSWYFDAMMSVFASEKILIKGGGGRSAESFLYLLPCSFEIYSRCQIEIESVRVALTTIDAG